MHFSWSPLFVFFVNVPTRVINRPSFFLLMGLHTLFILFNTRQFLSYNLSLLLPSLNRYHFLVDLYLFSLLCLSSSYFQIYNRFLNSLSCLIVFFSFLFSPLYSPPLSHHFSPHLSLFSFFSFYLSISLSLYLSFSSSLYFSPLLTAFLSLFFLLSFFLSLSPSCFHIYSSFNIYFFSDFLILYSPSLSLFHIQSLSLSLPLLISFFSFFSFSPSLTFSFFIPFLFFLFSSSCLSLSFFFTFLPLIFTLSLSSLSSSDCLILYSPFLPLFPSFLSLHLSLFLFLYSSLFLCLFFSLSFFLSFFLFFHLLTFTSPPTLIFIFSLSSFSLK
ncbi:unnamed protein product [Acanthosepion pharaonis]|uniref:Uncharacterized protein n=1 Tax=Acanthosepion pharaonis TaxID=158019 RepID=A0A812DYT0_ACAPH|nr:unnamed protein product [Sepia pharaonis]